jgi:CDP-glucose 4,6-dehydratase
MDSNFCGIYKGRKVFVTGHTGFKGSWLTYWLFKMGADVTGYSLPPPTKPNHFECINQKITSITGDINNVVSLSNALTNSKAEIVFHLAAQPLVRLSYINPFETYMTNVLGTLNLFEACRNSNTVRAIVAITTDKVYDNKEWCWPYRENDPLGGYDPYSSSKACAEILITSYRNSFFNLERYGKNHKILLASVRAGNVIGGGDWGQDRLIPDIMKSCSENKPVFIRNPKSIRPWQHVLDCLSGYLLVGQHLLQGNKEMATSFNFGPSLDAQLTVEEVVLFVKKYWSSLEYCIQKSEDQLHEANYLKLDCSKARTMLFWQPIWNIEQALKHTVNWYKEYYEQKKVLTEENLFAYVQDAKKQGVIWTK